MSEFQRGILFTVLRYLVVKITSYEINFRLLHIIFQIKMRINNRVTVQSDMLLPIGLTLLSIVYYARF